MQEQIDMICTLTGCDQDMAKNTFEQTGDVTLAVDKILFKTELPPKKKRVLDEVGSELEKIRETMKELDKQMDARPDSTINQYSTSSSRLAREVSVSRPVRRGETVLQNNYSQEYQLPVLQSEAQIQETVCPSQSESICDSPSRDQT
jgi:hypothetical protein